MVAPGRVAVVHFVGRMAEGDDAGNVFDTTDVDVALAEGIYHGHRDYKPLEFRVGEGTVMPAIDEAVQEMAVGESRTIQVEPEAAFGLRREGRVVRIPRTELEPDDDLIADEGELVRTETGETGWITSVTDETIEVDFNHELAGSPVEFEIRVLDVYDK